MQKQANQLTDLIRAIFATAGSNNEEAAAIAENLVMANLSGHDSHGIGMVPRYVDDTIRKAVNANHHAVVTSENGPVVQIDGQMGYGLVIGAEAMEIGIAKAQESGVAIVGLTNSYHLGRIGAWGEQCADAGLVSIHYVNTTGHPPLVAPFGGAEGRYSTNPYCAAIPATEKNPQIVLDMATSKIAMGKVRVAYNKGVAVGEDTLITPEGVASTDPGVMFADPRGAILSFGDHKGYGLAFLCEVLAGALNNGPSCLPVHQARNTIINNMLSIILDPAALGDASTFKSELDAITEYVKSANPAQGVDEVMVPGDPERKSRIERGANGIPIDDTTWQEILNAAKAVGLNDVDELIAA